MKLKKITNSDIEPLSRIFFGQENEYLEFFLPFKNKEELEELISKARKDIFYLITHKKDIVGYISLRGLDDGYSNPRFGIFISEKYSNKGYGYSASKEVIKIVADSGNYSFIDLKVDPRNIRAINLYKKIGFEVHSTDGEENIMILHF